MVTLKDVIPFEWDSFYHIMPFASSSRIEQMTGIEGIDSIDLQRLLLLVKDGKIIYKTVEDYNPEKPFLLEISNDDGFIHIIPEQASFRVLKSEHFTELVNLEDF